MGDVTLDRLGRDAQCRRNRSIGDLARDKAEHFDFAFRQCDRRRSACLLATPAGRDKDGVNGISVEPPLLCLRRQKVRRRIFGNRHPI